MIIEVIIKIMGRNNSVYPTKMKMCRINDFSYNFDFNDTISLDSKYRITLNSYYCK